MCRFCSFINTDRSLFVCAPRLDDDLKCCPRARFRIYATKASIISDPAMGAVALDSFRSAVWTDDLLNHLGWLNADLFWFNEGLWRVAAWPAHFSFFSIGFFHLFHQFDPSTHVDPLFVSRLTLAWFFLSAKMFARCSLSSSSFGNRPTCRMSAAAIAYTSQSQ